MKRNFLAIGQSLYYLYSQNCLKDRCTIKLIDYINENKLLYKSRFGFQKGKDTSMALIMLVDKVSEA